MYRRTSVKFKSYNSHNATQPRQAKTPEFETIKNVFSFVKIFCLIFYDGSRNKNPILNINYRLKRLMNGFLALSTFSLALAHLPPESNVLTFTSLLSRVFNRNVNDFHPLLGHVHIHVCKSVKVLCCVHVRRNSEP